MRSSPLHRHGGPSMSGMLLRRVVGSGTVAFLLAALVPLVQAQSLAVCGPRTSMQICEADRACDAVPVYEVPDYWHGLAQCMRALREVWSRKGPDASAGLPARKGEGSVGVSEQVRRQVVREMSRPHVRFFAAGDVSGKGFGFESAFGPDGRPQKSFDRVALLNDKGEPYNGMGQSGLAYFLYQMAGLADRAAYPRAKSDAQMYSALARGALSTVLTPVAMGGLASTRPCGADGGMRCTWYHSVTRRDRDTEAGATLNQDLHVIRDLGQTADLLAKQQQNVGIDFEKAIREGLNQLAFSSGGDRIGATPNLKDFLGPASGEAGVRWAYYGYDPTSTKTPRGYFLNSGGKDCGYHMHVLDLMSQILRRAESKGYLDPYKPALLSCDSPLAALHRAAGLRKSQRAKESLWSTREVGRDFSCPKLSETVEAESGSATFLDRMFDACPAAR